MTRTASQPGQADVDAALLLLSRMGVTPEDLLRAGPGRGLAPTFAEYVPVVAAAVSPASRRAYGTYWNRVLASWGDRRIDEPTPSEIRALAEHLRAAVVVRRNSRGGHSAEENLITALRCLCRHAVADGHVASERNPAAKVDKPRRVGSRRLTIGWRRSTT